MSRYNVHHEAAPVHDAAALWRSRCLDTDGSVFVEGKILWKSKILDELDLHFVQNLSTGEGDFYQKLETQLAGGSPESHQLMAEIMWILLLFSASIRPSTKKSGVRRIWSWSGEELDPDHRLFSDAVNGGLGATGTGFNNHRWRELVFLIGAFRALKSMDVQKRSEVLSDPWIFDDWLTSLPDGFNRQIASILPHLLFPDEFERVSSKGHKWALLSWYQDKPIRVFRTWKPVEVDRALYDLRKSLEKDAGHEIDFYSGGQFSEWLNQPPSLKQKAVKRWVSVLTSEFEGFQRFDEPHQEFDEVETNYKLERAENLRKAFEICKAPEDYIRAIQEAFSGYNLFNWRVLATLEEDWPKRALGECVASFLECSGENPEEFVDAFVEAWMADCPKPQMDHSRQIAGALAMHLFPDSAVYFRRTVLDECYKEGMGQDFPRSEDLALEYAEELRFARAVERAFAKQGLAPRNLIDVQSALWVVHNHKSDATSSIENTAKSGTALADKAVTGPLNTILYGPPGTGKTYETAARAVRICDGGVPEDRGAVMTRYAELCAANRIEFVTFHQSYGYEEFVEGLRPMTGGDGQGAGFRLEPVDGALKKMAMNARRPIAATDPNHEFSTENRQIFKVALGMQSNPLVEEQRQACFDNGYIANYFGGEVDWSPAELETYEAMLAYWRSLPGNKNASHKNQHVEQAWQIRSRMKPDDVVVVPSGLRKICAIGIVTGDYEYVATDKYDYRHHRPVNWVWIDETGNGIDVSDFYDSDLSSHMLNGLNMKKVRWGGLLPYLVSDAEFAEATPLPHVLIVDEINRANISKVMGEMITLLEEDKREGQENELSVVLPHSKKHFTLPSNLHILGTMNTADRSIALLDTALRRRFHFEAVDPDPSLLNPVGGIDLAAVLTAINQRLEYLIGPDHLIGHAWMMGARDIAHLDDIMANKVIPLLREYFHEDLGRVRAVLGGGDAFLHRVELTAPPGLDEGYGETRYRYVVAPSFGAAAYRELILGVSDIGDSL